MVTPPGVVPAHGSHPQPPTAVSSDSAEAGKPQGQVLLAVTQPHTLQPQPLSPQQEQVSQVGMPSSPASVPQSHMLPHPAKSVRHAASAQVL